jgi:hypothetical protein
MTETEWQVCDDPAALLSFMLGEPVLGEYFGPEILELRRMRYPLCRVSDRKLRLFACACCRGVWDWMTDERSRRAVDVAELHADGIAPESEMQVAHGEAELALGTTGNTAMDAAWFVSWGEAGESAVHVLYYCSHASYADSFRFWTYKRKAEQTRRFQLTVEHDIFGNPFRPVTFTPNWRTTTALQLAQAMYESRDFSPLPILADALQEAGCENTDILDHCRGPGPHVRGCWVVDLVLGKS